MKKLPLVIPDASVLLKWVLDEVREEDAGNALKIREEFLAGQIRILLPSLCLYEFGNTVLRLVPDKAPLIMRYFLDFDFEEKAVNKGVISEIIRLVQGYKVTFYDAAYHALAISEGGVFVTADVKYIQRVQGEKSVTLLREYGS